MINKMRKLLVRNLLWINCFIALNFCYGADWESVDIGTSEVNGYVEGNLEDVLTLRASGKKIGSKSDHFFFKHSKSRGKTQVVGQILEFKQQTLNSGKPKVGLMIRQSDEIGAKNVFLGISKSGLILFQMRRQNGLNTIVRGYQNHLELPLWFKLEYDEDMCSAFVSKHGKKWSYLDHFKFSMNDDYHYAGMAISNGEALFQGVETSRSFRVTSVAKTKSNSDEKIKNRLPMASINKPQEIGSSDLISSTDEKSQMRGSSSDSMSSESHELDTNSSAATKSTGKVLTTKEVFHGEVSPTSAGTYKNEKSLLIYDAADSSGKGTINADMVESDRSVVVPSSKLVAKKTVMKGDEHRHTNTTKRNLLLSGIFFTALGLTIVWYAGSKWLEIKRHQALVEAYRHRSMMLKKQITIAKPHRPAAQATSASFSSRVS